MPLALLHKHCSDPLVNESIDDSLLAQVGNSDGFVVRVESVVVVAEEELAVALKDYRFNELGAFKLYQAVEVFESFFKSLREHLSLGLAEKDSFLVAICFDEVQTLVREHAKRLF